MSTNPRRYQGRAALWALALAAAGMLLLSVSEAAAAAEGMSALSPWTRDLSRPQEMAQAMSRMGTSVHGAEALAFYAAGLDAAKAGDQERATGYFQWAATLDAAFPEPHLALARSCLPARPGQAAHYLWAAACAAVADMSAQHVLAANILLGLCLIVVAGGLLVLLYVAILDVPRIHHTATELLRRWLPGRLAAPFAGLLLLVPLAWRLGLLPIAALIAGLVFAWIKPAGKRWVGAWVAFVAVVPMILWAVSPALLSPLDPRERPFLLQQAMVSPHSDGLDATLEDALQRYPEDGDLWFARGLQLERGGRIEAAQKAYAKALDHGGPPGQIHNNLGVVCFATGRVDDAMSHLEEATSLAPKHPRPHFNLSQVYARKLYFEKADQELAEANRLAFDRIRAAMRNQASTKDPNLLDETLSSGALWQSAWQSPRSMPSLPAGFRFLFPGSGWLFGPIVLLAFALGLGLGIRFLKILPTTGCVNCGRPVCRRCHRRIRREAYCAACGDLLLSAENVAYSRLILDSRLRRYRTLGTTMTAFAMWAFPGFHAVHQGRVAVAAITTFFFSWGLLAFFHPEALVSRMAWLPLGRGPWWPVASLLPLGTAALLTVISVLRLKTTAAPAPRRGEERAEPGEDEASGAGERYVA